MYQPECPVSVDWQSPDCESQILMVPSLLPLAICFPSGLHATGQTLNLREVNTRINRHKQKMLDNNLQTYRFIFWNLVHLYFFRAHIYEQKVTFASGWSHRHSKQEYIFLSLFSLEYSYKKTHPSEWPVSVDWQSPDCESQILMVSSPLPLAICFPSGLHATELTLYLWEVSTRIHNNQEGKLGIASPKSW